jgi:hypothetical protein
MKPIWTQKRSGVKCEIYKVRDFCGFTEVTYRNEPNYHKLVKLLPLSFDKAQKMSFEEIWRKTVKHYH